MRKSATSKKTQNFIWIHLRLATAGKPPPSSETNHNWNRQLINFGKTGSCFKFNYDLKIREVLQRNKSKIITLSLAEIAPQQKDGHVKKAQKVR